MTNTMKHLSLLGRMETDGLMLSLTGLFSENELDGACEKVERLELQARLKKNRSSQIQRKLVECGEFADLYSCLGRLPNGRRESGFDIKCTGAEARVYTGSGRSAGD